MNPTEDKLKTRKERHINYKKVLNKKKWREQRYNNKAKVLKWENIKRKQVLRQYQKELKKSGMHFEFNESKTINDRNNFKSLLTEAKLKYKEIREEKEKRKKMKEQERQKREEAMKAYRERKAIRHQKLFHKNGFGKPSMKGRLELLLEKIQKEYANNENKHL